MRTIANLKTTITSRLHGTTLNKLSDFYTLCQDAGEVMQMRIDLQETIRRASLPSPVYDNVFEYAIPSDFKAPADLKPQANGDTINNSSLSRTYDKDFSNRKKNNQFTVSWRDGVQFIKFSKANNTPVVFDEADVTTGWTVGGNASNLELDSYNYIAGSGSLKCDVSSAGALVNVILRLGNDSSNYYEKTVTAGHFEAFKQGWNLLRFDLSTATQVGTVNMASMDYVRVTTTYNTNQTAYYEKTLTNAIDLSDNYDTDGSVFLYEYFDSITSLTLLRLDNITIAIGSLYDITYYSNYLFRTSSGTWIAKPTVDTNILNLSEVSYKIFDAEISKLITQQVQGAMGVFDYTYWDNMLEGEEGLYALYEAQFPSERIEAQTTYYDTTGDSELLGRYNEDNE